MRMDLKTAMKQYLLSIWQTKEIEEFLLWVRDYNKKNKIRFYFPEPISILYPIRLRFSKMSLKIMVR